MNRFSSASALLYHISGPEEFDDQDCDDELEQELGSDHEYEPQVSTKKKNMTFEKTYKHFYFPREQPPEEKQCSICFGDDVKLHCVGACGHQFCVDCLNEYVRISLGDVSLLRHHLCEIKKQNLSQTFSQSSSNSLFGSTTNSPLTPSSPDSRSPISSASPSESGSQTPQEVDEDIPQRKTRTVIELSVKEDVPGLKCPHRSCNYVIQLEELSQFSDRMLLDKMNQLLFNSWLDENSKDLSYCSFCRKTALEYGSSSSVYCPECDIEYCQCCLLSPHPKLTCQEWKQKLEAEKKLRQQIQLNAVRFSRVSSILNSEKYQEYVFGKWLNESRHDVKSCPKCYVPIFKNGGCDHMYCSRCQTRYNWSQSVSAVENDHSWTSQYKDQGPQMYLSAQQKRTLKALGFAY